METLQINDLTFEECLEINGGGPREAGEAVGEVVGFAIGFALGIIVSTVEMAVEMK